MNIKCIILAAGQGTRMKSDIPKVLHQALGMPLIHYPIQAAKNIGAKEIGVIIGHQADKVKNVLGDDFAYYYQTEQLGTGHAVMQAIDFIEDDTQILILCGDVPLITSDVLQKMINVHSQMKNSVTVLSAKVDHPYGYGRIARDTSGKFVKIVEEKDATKEEKAINEINGGIYIFEGKALKHALSKLVSFFAPRNTLL
jgi:bifunctional UDP-N-acetylglucosamine pyrophosphorylase/glucosamine-1-phosphate N-acetyltransferase